MEVTVLSPEPVTLIVFKSAAKLKSRPRSDGLIGAAPTFINTSSSEGLGLSTDAIDI